MGWPQPGRTPQTQTNFQTSGYSTEKRRNRHETRTVAVFDATPAVVGTQWEPYVAAVVQVERTVHAFQPATGLWRTSAETSFYLCNCMIDANRAAIAVRMHWGIENKFHYTRDVTLREDASRIRKNPGVFARIRSPTIFSGSINPTPSRKTATPPLSAVSNPYFL